MQFNGSHSNVAGVVVDKKFAQEADSLSTSLTNSLGQFFFVFNRIMSNEPQKKTWLVGLYGGLYYSVL